MAPQPLHPRRRGPCAPLPLALRMRLRQHGVLPTPFLLTVSVSAQTLTLWARLKCPHAPFPGLYQTLRRHRISTSKFGCGQQEGSFRTPLGLHRVARKIGGGHPIGTVWRSRQAVGFLWAGLPHSAICHRILWLSGLEPGFNQGGRVDTFLRYIYLHGFADESTLGRPQSQGCIHVAASDLLPLYDLVPENTLVWISP